MGEIRLSLIIGISLLLAGINGAANAAGTTPPFIRADNSITLANEPAAGLFLVAHRTLDDPHFRQSVIYLLQHGPLGSLGLIVNRPSGLKLSDAVSGIKDADTTPRRMFFGGPVEISTVWMLIRDEQESRLVQHIADDVYLSGDRTVLDRLLNEKKPDDSLHFYLGHAGWLPGQLTLEIKQGDWYVIHTDPAVIFSADPGSIWTRLIEKLDPSGIYAGDGKTEDPRAGASSRMPPLIDLTSQFGSTGEGNTDLSG
jgi:putative transcriptional regulator